MTQPLDTLGDAVMTAYADLVDAHGADEARALLTRSLRTTAVLFDPLPPPALDPVASAKRMEEIGAEWMEAQVDFGAACATAVTQFVEVIRDDMATMIETDGADAVKAHRMANHLMAAKLEEIAGALRPPPLDDTRR
jgi:hypothetical protein